MLLMSDVDITLEKNDDCENDQSEVQMKKSVGEDKINPIMADFVAKSKSQKESLQKLRPF